MTAPKQAEPLDLAGLIADPETRIVVCCGAGGVGKTTTSAALALAAAEAGRSVVVLTIDPARRLAQSLGLTELDNEPRRVDVPGASGELHAMMLDMKRTFDDVVVAHSTPERAEQILANPFYQTLSSSFAGTQEYMAMEKLGQLRASDQWDLIIVDTPPSRSALDFLDAPNRHGPLPRRHHDPAAHRPRAGRRPGRVAAGRAPGSGCSAGSSPRSSAASCCSDISAFVGALDTHVRRLPRAGDGDLRAAAAAGHLRSSSSPPRSRTRCARPPTSSTGCRPRRCRWPAWCSTARTRRRRRHCRPPAPRPPPRPWPSPAAGARSWPPGRCACTPSGWRWPPASSGWATASPRPTRRCRAHGAGRGRRRARPGRPAGHGRGAHRPGRRHPTGTPRTRVLPARRG